jgi:hypothetical protein
MRIGGASTRGILSGDDALATAKHVLEWRKKVDKQESLDIASIREIGDSGNRGDHGNRGNRGQTTVSRNSAK